MSGHASLSAEERRRPTGSTSACRSWSSSKARCSIFRRPRTSITGGPSAASWPSCWWCRSSPASCWRCTTRPHVDMAFDSVEHIMRDVNYGWLIRYMHANGASMFFIAVYIHIFRGMYYGSYKAPREVLWMIGVLIYPGDDGDRLHGLCAALGPDELLGRQGHHQPVLGHSVLRRADRHLAVGRLFVSTIRRSTASSRCTTCCHSCWRAWWSCTSGRCMCRATAIRPASIVRSGPGHRAFPSLLHDEGRLSRSWCS